MTFKVGDHHNLGIKRSDEFKKKLSDANIGKKLSEETKRKMSESRMGHVGYTNGMKHTEEAKRKISEASKNREREPLSQETKDKIGNANRGNNHTYEVRLRISKTLRDKKETNVKWKGGITSETRRLRGSVEYKIWRDTVFIRDNWTCQKCYKRGGYLNAHHIKFFSEFPELRFDINNGITLCKSCHILEHSKLKIENNE